MTYFFINWDYLKPYRIFIYTFIFHYFINCRQQIVAKNKWTHFFYLFHIIKKYTFTENIFPLFIFWFSQINPLANRIIQLIKNHHKTKEK